MRILLVDDDAALRELLTRRLSAENYAIDAASDGDQGWEYATTYEYDLLILDVLLPRLDGVTLCQKLRAEGNPVPILLLTAQNSRDAKLTGWAAGADDYVVKPFDEAELLARIRALLRRSQTNPLPILTWGELWLNTNTNEASYGDRELALTVKEYAILELMLRDCQHVFSNEEILDSLWTSEEFPADATVRSHIRRLRHKLSVIGAPSDFITTAHGHGYYLKPMESDACALPPNDPPPRLKPRVPPTTDSAANPTTDPTADQAAQYHQLLNQTWQKHQSSCCDRVEQLASAIAQLATQTLSREAQAEAYRLAHTLSGTLGTFGLTDAMQISRQIEQEIHPDLYLEPAQGADLQRQITTLHQIVRETQSLPAPIAVISDRQVPDRQPLRSSAHQRVRVLVVDDDPIFLQTVGGQLQVHGFDVAVLSDPRQFWPMLENTAPEILLLDVQMPQINGLELCETLRAAPHWQKLPVMFLSILGDAQTQHRAFAAGADDYLFKPITAQHLGDRIRQRLQRIQALSCP
jgi:DNA-binding response OmpR family regulator/HPt (histidine-containing phosphotransfer) domain-containing protein